MPGNQLSCSETCITVRSSAIHPNDNNHIRSRDYFFPGHEEEFCPQPRNVKGSEEGGSDGGTSVDGTREVGIMFPVMESWSTCISVRSIA